jgi:hypothetical protein
LRQNLQLKGFGGGRREVIPEVDGMGYWGVGPFENDTALDWVADLVKSKGLELMREALGPWPKEPDELDAPTADQILAAAEVLAATGRPIRLCNLSAFCRRPCLSARKS